jgi:hypothetical protein
MKWQWSLLALVLVASVGRAEEPRQDAAAGVTSVLASSDPVSAPPASFDCAGADRGAGGMLAGNHNFDHFIGFMSNPIFNIDPRAVTELWPLFGSSWISSIPALPSANAWVPGGAGLNVALSERLSFGINQGGYVLINFSKGDFGRFLDHLGRPHDKHEFAGERDGWLNLGGFVQYTLIQDVPDQFLLTAGLRVVAPIGSREVFQGRGPADLAPYLTAGKEIGDFHVLATVGYQFPAGNGETDFFYGCLHFDRRTFGWLYPLVEFNWIYHSTNVSLDLPTRFGFFDFGDFETTGNLVNLAAGANAVLIPSKLEVGAVYETTIVAQHHFNMNGFLVKLTLRY